MTPTSVTSALNSIELGSLLNKTQPDRSLRSAAKFLRFLDYVPFYLRNGPWSPVMYLIIALFSVSLLISYSRSIRYYNYGRYEDSSGFLTGFRLCFGIYCCTVTAITYYKMGVWPFFSYTLTSWNLLGLRLACSYLAGAGFSLLGIVADIVRLPALIGCTITVVVYWFVLTPLIMALLLKNNQDSSFFWKFSLSPGLLNVHLLNLPIAAAEFSLSQSPLTYFDLWVSLSVALVYCIIYLNVLDRLGLHFYIIFTPRTHLCFIPYSAIILAYIGLYHSWNSIF